MGKCKIYSAALLIQVNYVRTRVFIHFVKFPTDQSKQGFDLNNIAHASVNAQSLVTLRSWIRTPPRVELRDLIQIILYPKIFAFLAVLVFSKCFLAGFGAFSIFKFKVIEGTH